MKTEEIVTKMRTVLLLLGLMVSMPVLAQLCGTPARHEILWQREESLPIRGRADLRGLKEPEFCYAIPCGYGFSFCKRV